MFLTIVSGLSRTHGLAQGAHPLGARQSPPAAHQHAPKMAPAAPGPDRVLDPDPNPNPGKTGFCSRVHILMVFS